MELQLQSTSFQEYLQSKLFQLRAKNGMDIRHKKSKIQATPDEWDQYLDATYSLEYRVVQTDFDAGFILDDDSDGLIAFSVFSGTVNLEFWGDRDFVIAEKRRIEKDFKTVSSYVTWKYSPEGHSISALLDTTLLPVDSMYPIIKNGLTDYFDRFLKSNASILLLIGMPGTGKTTLIRGLIHHAKTSAYVCYDPTILAHDSIFATWVDSKTSNIMVLEDSDTFLQDRQDGNSLMARFLNVGDGLVSVKGKKLVFSTNLPSINDVDPALLRPGRCFDVLRFNLLTPEQAQKVADDFGIELQTKKKAYTIADIFNKEHSYKETKFGFN